MSLQLVLFDLGGVLQQLHGVHEFAAMVGTDSEEALWELWLTSPWVKRFERGDCDAVAFSRGMVESLSLRCDAETFLARFATWPGGFYEGAQALVDEVQRRVPTACLSNTNALHYAQVLQPSGVATLFPMHFLSFQMGHVKPDPQAFEHVLQQTGLPAEAVLFIDDNRINVQSARALGFAAEVAKGPMAAREVLRARGLAD